MNKIIVTITPGFGCCDQEVFSNAELQTYKEFRSILAFVFTKPFPMHYLHHGVKLLIALVWFINGLYCKLLNLVPRHQAIVAKILGDGQAGLITRMIGLSEILMAIWVISNVRSRLCTLTQVFVIVLMNLLEFFLAPELLLFGRCNAILATLLICMILFSEHLNNKLQNKVAR